MDSDQTRGPDETEDVDAIEDVDGIRDTGHTGRLWSAEVARTYDHDAAAMFAPDVLGPTVEFLAARADGGPALEFAVGTGRVALALADRGVPVSGVEQSPAMVAEMVAKAGGDRVPVVVGDMATATVPGRFALVYLVFNTISNLLTQDAQVECFRNAARHLAPGGAFVVELGVPQLQRLPPGETARPFEVGEHHLGIDTHDLVRQRLVSHHYRDVDGAFAVFRSEHRWAWPAELDLMARLAGLRPTERWADWHENPFTAESASHVSVWRRPAALDGAPSSTSRPGGPGPWPGPAGTRW